MNCHDFENVVNDLAREQMMKASVRIESLVHRDECEACARRLEDESALSFKLRALAAETRLVEAPALEAGLRTAFRDHQFAISRRAAAHRWRYWAAAAAIVLTVIAVAEMRFRPVMPSAQNQPSSWSAPPRETSDRRAIGEAPTPVVDSMPSVLPPRPALASHRPGRRSTNRLIASSRTTASHASKDIVPVEAPTTVATNRSTTEITTDFMPVGYQNPINLQDGGQIVRVQLPRSALVAFGLPVNMGRYNEKVKADVFFGADGMARAIRFVQ